MACDDGGREVNRRGFIAGAVAAALAPKAFAAPSVRTYAATALAPAIAPVLSEAALEQVMIDITRSGVGMWRITPTHIILRQGLEDVFTKAFEECSVGWREVFQDDGVPLLSSIHPDNSTD